MTYARIEDGTVAEYPIYEGDLRLLVGNTDYSAPLVPPVGYEPVVDVPMPNPGHTKNVVEGTPKLNDGKWTRVWVITDASDDEIAQRTEQMAVQVRYDRNLLASDWTQLADSPVDQAAWAAYRQQLREVPSQDGFPWDVTWPLDPYSSTAQEPSTDA
jgi:hypothetical protein